MIDTIVFSACEETLIDSVGIVNGEFNTWVKRFGGIQVLGIDTGLHEVSHPDISPRVAYFLTVIYKDEK